MSDIAIVHSELTSDGGAERVAIQMARTFGAPIYSPKIDPSFVPDDVDTREIFNSRWADLFLNEGRKPTTAYWIGKHLYQMQRAQWIEDLYDYDTIIQTKPGTDWFIPKDGQTLIRYVHHVQRRHYDQFYLKGESVKERVWSLFHRTMHKQTVDYPDLYIANSDLTKRRIERYWGVPEGDIRVVYPGVRVPETTIQTDETEDYLFHVGRLAHNKRIDLLVDVAREIDTKIVVAGTGPKQETIENGPENIDYLGYISESEKWDYLSRAKGTLFLAENEDFGIVPIESMAAGTPVIGVREGFTEHQIKDEKNGYLCAPTVASVACEIALLENTGVAWSEQQIKAYADQFRVERFSAQMQDCLADAEGRASYETNIQTPEIPQ